MNDRGFINLWLKLALLVLLAFGVQLATAQSVEVLEETSEDRVVKHVLGETRIPAQPERVVSLTVSLTDAMLEFGVPLAGAAPFLAGEHVPYLADALQDVPKVGSDEYTLNLEAILAQQPDLIVLYAFEGKVVSNLTYEQLSQIAPTVVFDWAHLYDDFRTGFSEAGALLGVPERTAARLGAYDAELAEARATLAEFPDTKLAILAFGGREIRLRGDVGASGSLLYTSLGFDMPALTEELAAREEFVTVSLESVPELADADFILLQVDEGDEESGATLRTLEESNLWRSLPAVQQNRVFSLRSDKFINTLRANELVVGELLEMLTGQTN